MAIARVVGDRVRAPIEREQAAEEVEHGLLGRERARMVHGGERAPGVSMIDVVTYASR